MARDLASLDSDFRAAVEAVLASCAARGVVIQPYCWTRPPHEQARLWRRSRSGAAIQAAARKMRAAGAPWLASVLLDVGPQYGPWATGALPGLSWHQHDLAVDGCVVDDDDLDGDGSTTDALWSTTAIDRQAEANGYAVWRQEGLAHGLYIAVERDWPHLQARPEGSPLSLWSWPEIDAAMRERWS